MNQSIAALALAAAALVPAGRPGPGRLHAVTARPSPLTPPTAVRPIWMLIGAAATGALLWAASGRAVVALATAAGAAGVGSLAMRRMDRARRRGDDPVDLAAAWEQLAACLEVGLPVAVAVAAAAEPLEGDAGVELRRVAGLLELGADPAAAWHAARASPPLAAFARAAGRSGGTGAALAHTARAEGTRLRSALTDAAEARAQRAAVLITAPLGLCFLPAFIVLGIAPVVVGLAGEALTGW
jgi:Flp pilus assembly protein TadB